MQIAICDDDQQTVKELTQYACDFFSASGLKPPQTDAYFNAVDLIASGVRYDIIFLDIEMPRMNGIDAAEKILNKHKSALIFIVTAYPDYLDDAMRAHVFRYLSKPIEKERLFRNLRDALNVYQSSTAKIAIETKQGVATFLSSDVVMLEKSGRKVNVYTTKGVYETTRPMQHYIATLPSAAFFQTHKSFIVNMTYVNDFDREKVRLYHDKYMAYLTRRKYTDFKNAYLCFLEGER